MRTMRVPSTDGVVLAVHDHGVVTRAADGASLSSSKSPKETTTKTSDLVTLLLAHANGFHGRVFDPVVDAMTRARNLPFDVRVVAFDFRGHGRSSAPTTTPSAEESYRWEKFAEDARAVVANLNLRGACVGVGHSLGAHALLRAEAADPGTFSSVHAYEPVFVVSADRVPGPPAPPANLAAAASRRRETFESREDALRAYASKPPLSALRRDALEAYVDHGFVDAEAEAADAKEKKLTKGGRRDGGGDAAAAVDRARGPVTLACPRDVEALVFERGGEERDAIAIVSGGRSAWDGGDKGGDRTGGGSDSASFGRRATVRYFGARCPVTISRGAATDPRDRSKGMYASAIAPVVAGDLGDNARVETHDALGHFGAFYTLVPIRPRSRGERLFLRTFPGASLRLPLAFNPRPRRLSTPTDAFQLHPDIRSYGTTLRPAGGPGDVRGERVEARGVGGGRRGGGGDGGGRRGRTDRRQGAEPDVRGRACRV